jgi:hypothetical protein
VGKTQVFLANALGFMILMQKIQFMCINHGIIPTAAMCILAGDYHQGWKTPMYYSPADALSF